MRSAKEYKAIREEIYRFIGAYITKHVYAPSNKEIAEAVEYPEQQCTDTSLT